MSEVFKVGDIAIVINQVGKYTHLNGMEIVITGSLEIRRVFNVPAQSHVMLYCYEVRFSDGAISYFPPDHLRKKRPPTEYTGEMRVMELFTKPPVVQPEGVPA